MSVESWLQEASRIFGTHGDDAAFLYAMDETIDISDDDDGCGGGGVRVSAPPPAPKAVYPKFDHDECIICLEAICERGADALVYCGAGCGIVMHTACQEKCADASACPQCRRVGSVGYIPEEMRTAHF